VAVVAVAAAGALEVLDRGVRGGDRQGLLDVLAPDVVVVSDGLSRWLIRWCPHALPAGRPVTRARARRCGAHRSEVSGNKKLTS
jgi:hypothetical protein